MSRARAISVRVGALHVAPLAALLGALLLPAASRAQAPEPARLVAGVSTVGAPAADPQPVVIERRDAGDQMLFGVVGAYGGALVGGLVAAQVLPQTQCGDTPGLCQAIPGAIVGMLVGAAVGAAIPPDGEQCSQPRRTLYGIGGGALGFLAGVAAAVVLPPAGLVTVPGGTGVGAGIAAWACG